MSTLSIGKRRFLSNIGIRKLSTNEVAEIDQHQYDAVLLPLAQKLKNDLLATPNADVTALEELMTKAANEASSGKYDKAVKTLEAKAVKKAYALAKVTAQGASKKQQSEALFRVKYGERKQKLEDAVNVLRTMPGTGDVQEQLRQNRAAGEQLAATSPPDYEKAFNALGKVEDKLKDALKASKESLKAANAIPEVKAALQTFETHFQELETLAPDEELQEIKAAQVAVLALVSTGKKKNKTDKESAADCANGLDQVTNQVLKRIGLLKKAQESYTKNSKDITKKLKELEDCSTVLTRAPYEDRLKRAATLMAQRRFDQAAELVKADVADLQKKLDTWPAARQAWEDQRPERKKIMSALKELAECPATQEMHDECSAELERLRSMAKDDREDNYDIARKGVEDLKLLVESLKTDVLVPYGKLSKVRKAADKKVQDAYDEVEAALKEVQKRIEMGGGPADAEFGEFNTRLADALADWKSISATAIQAEDLTADAKVVELKKIGRELDAAASDLDTYTNYADEATTKAEKAEYDKVRAQVDQALKGISELGGETINTLLIEVQGLYKKTDADKKYSAATTRLRDQVLGQIQRLKNTFGPDLERYAGEARQAQTEASQAVKTLQNKLGDSKYKGLFKSLQEELSDLTGMIESTNLDTVKGAKKEIAAFKQRLATLAQNLTGKDPAAKNFQKIEAEISTLTDTLDNANLKKWRPTQFGGFTQRFGELGKDVRTKAPEVGLPLLNTFKTEVDNAITAADTAASWFETFEQDRKAIKKNLDKLTGADQYLKTLKERLSDLQTAFKTAENTTKEGEVVTQLSGLKIEVHEAVSKPEVRQQKETDVRLANAKQLEEEATFKGLMEVFKQGLYKEAKAVGKDKTALKNLESRTKGAQKVADGGNFQTATQQLESAKALAEQIKANPRGFAATARGKLKAMRKVWIDGVTGFNKSLDNLIQAIEKDGADTGEIPGATLTIARTAITDLKAMFNPLVFDKAINVLQDKKIPAPKRRAARENALRTVREYLKIVQNDPMIIKLSVGTPYKPPIASSGLYQALVNLDLNIRRCI